MIATRKGGKVFSAIFEKRHTNGRLNAKVLVLNQNYEPMSVCNVRKAIIMLYLGKAEIIEEYLDKRVRSISATFPFPSIVRLGVYVHVPYKKIILSRKNILRRDNHRCQYCGRSDLPLTIDHVNPKSKGGTDSWENMVCACVKCNNKKGDRLPHEVDMNLRRQPFKPNHVTFIRHYVGQVDERWKPYLFMN